MVAELMVKNILSSISFNSGEEVIVCRDTVAISSYFVGCNLDFIILDIKQL